MAEFIRLNRKCSTILMVTHDSKVAARCGILIFALRYQGSFCGVADVDPKKTVSYIEVFTD